MGLRISREQQVANGDAKIENNFLKMVESKLGIVLNDIQKAAVTHQDGALLLLATPGAGKTTVLNLHIAYLILEQKVNPDSILSLTFSKASAKDMELRFNALFGNMISNLVRFSTIHSFAFKVVRDYFRQNRINYELIETEDRANGKVAVLKRLYQQFNNILITEEKLEELANAIGYVKNSMMKIEDIEKEDFSIENFKEIYLAYEDYKKNSKSPIILLDFDDMLTTANNILEQNPQILSSYQTQFKYILIDESQDTSLIQHKIIEKIAKPQDNIFVVGDEDQAIYGFRGAEPQYLLDFKKVYPKAKNLAMTENFRSSKDIVSITNDFIKANKKRYQKNMFTNNPSQKTIQVHDFKTDIDQLDYVVEQLNKTKQLLDVAVLYRNNASAICLINKLEAAKIPFYMKDFKVRFFNHWVVNDILNFLRLSYSDKNVTILERIHTKLEVYISKIDIEYLKGADTTISAFQNLAKHYEEVRNKAEEFLALQKKFKKLNQMSPKKAIQFIRTELKYESKVEKICEDLGHSLENIKGILATLENIAADLNTHEEFAYRLKLLENLMNESKFNKNRDAVTLSTMHSAKGLEFKHVLMIDLIQGVIPSAECFRQNKKDKGNGLEEERRLFYVGMTRAIEELVLLTAQEHFKEKVKESQFLREVRQILNPEIKEERVTSTSSSEQIAVGVFVEHKKFGVGKVLAISKDTISIGFENGSVKKLLLQVCLDNQLINVL